MMFGVPGIDSYYYIPNFYARNVGLWVIIWISIFSLIGPALMSLIVALYRERKIKTQPLSLVGPSGLPSK